MRKLGLLIALLFVLAGCSEKPQPAVLPMPMAAPFTPGTRTWGDGVVTTGARYFDVTPPNVSCDGNPAKSCSWIRLPSALGQ